jgi:DNA modification methylase
VTKGAVYMCMSSSELNTLQKAFRDAGGKWSTFVIWAKNTFTLAERTGRRARLIELDPKYVDVIIQRWQQLTGGEARLANASRPFGAPARHCAPDQLKGQSDMIGINRS